MLKAKLGVRSVNFRKSLVFLTLMLLVSSLFVGIFTPRVEGQTAVTVGTETELKAAISNAANNAAVVIAIDKPIALTAALTVPANKDITLKSAGNAEFELFGATGANTITVETRGILTLAGIIVTHVSGAGGVGVTVSSGGKLTMTGGKISANTPTYSYSGGGVSNSGNFTLTGGTISNNNDYGVYTTGAGSNFTMSGGEITNNRNGVYLSTTNSFFNMTNGKISGNTNNGVYNSGTFTLTGGEISDNAHGVDNRATYIMSGGKISNNTVGGNGAGVSNAGTFTLSGGEISGNTVTGNYNGGGVYNSGTFTMSGGEVANNAAYNGGGIYIYSGNFNLYGGKISGNTASRNGGGVWVTDTVTNLNRLFVRAGVVFSDNRALAAYNRDPAHDSTYAAYIESGVTWTAPFTQGYNNFDISYVYGASITTFTVTIQDSFAETSGTGGYSVGATVTLNAGTRTGYNFYRWAVNEGGVLLSSTTSTTATFAMPTSNVVVTASWNIISYSISYTLGGGSASGNPSSYNVGNSFPIAIANPTRAGYEFLGWNVTYANGTQTSFQTSYSIPEGTTGNIALAANWKTPATNDSGNSGGGGSNGSGSGGGSSGGGGGQSSAGGNTQPTPTPTAVPSNNGQPDNNSGVLSPRDTDDNEQQASTDNNNTIILPEFIANNLFVIILLVAGFVFVCALYFFFKDRKEQPAQAEQSQSDAQQQEWAEEQEFTGDKYTENGYAENSGDSVKDDPFEILGVTNTSTETEVESAYKDKCKSWHYDTLTQKQKNDPTFVKMAHEEMCKINKAYNDIKQLKEWK